MLSFATEFPIRETTSNGFVDAVRRWMIGSPHANFSTETLKDIPESGRWKLETDDNCLEGLFSRRGFSETSAFKYTATDGQIEWVTEVVFSKSEFDNWVGIRTSRESFQPQSSLPPAKKPLLVRTIIDGLGGGLDGEIYVSDKPHFLSENDVTMAVRLLNADSDNYLPLVYLSYPFPGEPAIDPYPLARSLGGMAHVIVEPSRDFSRSIQKDVGSRNVYGGSVGVYWPSGQRFKYYFNNFIENEFDLRQAIVWDIRAALVNRRPFGRCTWSKAEAEVAQSVFESLKSSGSHDVAEYVAAFDVEIAAKDSQLQDAEAEIVSLRAQIRSLDRRNQSQLNSWSIESEQELRDGEFSEILKEAIDAAANNSQDGSRRQHVLHAAAAGIPNSDNLKICREKLKDILKGYRNMTPTIKSDLNNLGFTIDDDGKHYKLIYMQDDRYTFPLPKSGSDWRGGMNAASDISKRVF
jgi:hypothetical protein